VATDIAIDFVTRRFITTSDGAWLETEDSRTAVLLQLEIEEGTSYGDPTSGSKLAALRRRQAPATLQEMSDETRRALQALVDAGIISDLVVVPQGERDETGRGVIIINYRDRTSGHPVDVAYAPWGGSAR